MPAHGQLQRFIAHASLVAESLDVITPQLTQHITRLRQITTPLIAHRRLSPRNLSSPRGSILHHLLDRAHAIQRAVRAHARPIALPAMAEDLKVVIDEPVQILALGSECSRDAVAGLGVVRGRIGVVAVVFVVLVVGEVDSGVGVWLGGLLGAVLAEELGFGGVGVGAGAGGEGVRGEAGGSGSVGVEGGGYRGVLEGGWWLVLGVWEAWLYGERFWERGWCCESGNEALDVWREDGQFWMSDGRSEEQAHQLLLRQCVEVCTFLQDLSACAYPSTSRCLPRPGTGSRQPPAAAHPRPRSAGTARRAHTATPSRAR